MAETESNFQKMAETESNFQIMAETESNFQKMAETGSNFQFLTLFESLCLSSTLGVKGTALTLTLKETMMLQTNKEAELPKTK